MPTTRTVDTHVVQLRTKLRADLIESVRGIGYRLARDLTEGAPVDTWVLGSKLVASATPDVSALAPSESLASSNPVVRWTPFRSPEGAPFEEHTLSLYIHNLDVDRTAWDLWSERAGELGTVRVGEREGAAKTKLAPGSYWLALTAGENRSFGPITIARKSQAGVPFNIVK